MTGATPPAFTVPTPAVPISDMASAVTVPTEAPIRAGDATPAAEAPSARAPNVRAANAAGAAADVVTGAGDAGIGDPGAGDTGAGDTGIGDGAIVPFAIAEPAGAFDGSCPPAAA